MKAGQRVTITRGAPIEELSLDYALGYDEAIFALTDKLNELIARINAMNEIPRTANPEGS